MEAKKDEIKEEKKPVVKKPSRKGVDNKALKILADKAINKLRKLPYKNLKVTPTPFKFKYRLQATVAPDILPEIVTALNREGFNVTAVTADDTIAPSIEQDIILHFQCF